MVSVFSDSPVFRLESEASVVLELVAAPDAVLGVVVMLEVEVEVVDSLDTAVRAVCSSSGGGALNVLAVGSPHIRVPLTLVPQHCHNFVE